MGFSLEYAHFGPIYAKWTTTSVEFQLVSVCTSTELEARENNLQIHVNV